MTEETAIRIAEALESITGAIGMIGGIGCSLDYSLHDCLSLLYRNERLRQKEKADE